ncbi:MAG: FAD-binding oxidoreductase [Oscillochloridaceae bacterium umkhey_bin13]
MDQLINTLEQIVGTDHVSTNPSLPGRTPVLAISPGSVEETAQAVAACFEARVAVVPWGGGTRQTWGSPLAERPFVVIQTNRLNKVLIYEPDDLTISVEAGMTLATLDATLAANRQMLPLDAPWPERTTIGGILATGVDGPRRLLYGSSRDLLIGIRVVEATGRISKAGGMVVKNVSGFDMMKLYLGSLGSLALIVSANFKLLPRPRASGALSCGFEQPAAAFALAEAIAESYLTPAAVEYHEHQYPDDPLCGLEIRIEGLPAAVERHLRELEVMAKRAGASAVCTIADGDPVLKQRWAHLADLAHPATEVDDELALRLSCLPGELAAALNNARVLAQRHQVTLRVVARALNGVAYLRASGPPAELAAWHAALLAVQPYLVLLAAPPALVAELPAWGVADPNHDLMLRIKREFDPEDQLNPGRFVV